MSDAELLLLVKPRKMNDHVKKLISASLALLFSIAAMADGVGGRYENDHGIIQITEQQGGVAFDINSSVGQNTCGLDGIAKNIDGARAVYTPEDPADKCVAVLNFSPSGVKVATKGCENYCGMNAAGSMDGDYILKAPGGAQTETQQPAAPNSEDYACHGNGTKNTLLGIFFDNIAKEFGDAVAEDLAAKTSPDFDLIMIAGNDRDTGAVYCTARLKVNITALNMKKVVDRAVSEDTTERIYAASGQHYESVATGAVPPTSYDQEHAIWENISYKIQMTSDGSQHVVSLNNGQGFIKWFRMIVKFGGLEVASEKVTDAPVISNTTPSQPPISSETAKPSFDCAKASSANEKMICGDADLATLDSRLSATYNQAKIYAKNPVELKKQTVDAWKWREANCHDKACLVKWYEDRRVVLAGVAAN